MNYSHGFELVAFMAVAGVVVFLFCALLAGITKLFDKQPIVAGGIIITIIIISVFILGALAT